MRSTIISVAPKAEPIDRMWIAWAIGTFQKFSTMNRLKPVSCIQKARSSRKVPRIQSVILNSKSPMGPFSLVLMQ